MSTLNAIGFVVVVGIGRFISEFENSIYNKQSMDFCLVSTWKCHVINSSLNVLFVYISICLSIYTIWRIRNKQEGKSDENVNELDSHFIRTQQIVIDLSLRLISFSYSFVSWFYCMIVLLISYLSINIWRRRRRREKRISSCSIRLS